LGQQKQANFLAHVGDSGTSHTELDLVGLAGSNFSFPKDCIEIYVDVAHPARYYHCGVHGSDSHYG
jgi:hypothetical protein